MWLACFANLMNNKCRLFTNKHHSILMPLIEIALKSTCGTKIKLMHAKLWQQGLLSIHFKSVSIQTHIQVALHQLESKTLLTWCHSFLKVTKVLSFWIMWNAHFHFLQQKMLHLKLQCRVQWWAKFKTRYTNLYLCMYPCFAWFCTCPLWISMYLYRTTSQAIHFPSLRRD